MAIHNVKEHPVGLVHECCQQVTRTSAELRIGEQYTGMLNSTRRFNARLLACTCRVIDPESSASHDLGRSPIKRVLVQWSCKEEEG